MSFEIFHSSVVPFIPIPQEKQGRPVKYPFEALEINQGFVVPLEQAPKLITLKNYVQERGRKLQRSFLLGNNEDGNFVIWRAS